MIISSIKDTSIILELVRLTQSEKRQNIVHISNITSAHQYLLLYQLFQKYIPKGSKVLDWGAGNGHFSYFLCRKGYQTIGFSMENFTFKNWVKEYKYKFVKGQTTQPTKLPFKDNSFDAVASVGVLEHVQEFDGNERVSMDEIFRILKPGGIFICYHLPNHYSLTEFLAKILKKFHHTQRFTSTKIKQLSYKTNFEILEIQRYGFLPRNSLGKLPQWLRYSAVFATLWNNVDNIFSCLLSPLCQNYYFIAHKPKKL